MRYDGNLERKGYFQAEYSGKGLEEKEMQSNPEKKQDFMWPLEERGICTRRQQKLVRGEVWARRKKFSLGGVRVLEWEISRIKVEITSHD